MVGMNVESIAGAYKTQTDMYGSKGKTEQVKEKDAVSQKKSDYGKTVGEPKLSEAAEKYYKELKKKFGQYDFILVSKDEKENARANAGKYANSLKTVVLIDEEKIEKMATDENFRKQYEGILSGATKQIDEIKNAAANAGTSLKGLVMQVNDDGTTSFFAALKKSSDAQRDRIEKKAEEKKIHKKEEQKKAAKKEKEERLKESREAKAEEKEEVITFMADSFDSLIKKIEDYGFNERSNSIMTEGEKQVGQNFDFRG